MNTQATALTRRRGFAVATSVLGLFLFAAARRPPGSSPPSSLAA